MAAGRAVQGCPSSTAGETRADYLNEKQGPEARAAGWLRLQDRTGGHRQGRLCLSHNQGAAEYINDDTQVVHGPLQRPFVSLPRQRSAIIGSIFAGLYTKVTRIAPEKASELATAILDIGERIEYATSMDALRRACRRNSSKFFEAW